jgi:hypothetical protein
VYDHEKTSSKKKIYKMLILFIIIEAIFLISYSTPTSTPLTTDEQTHTMLNNDPNEMMFDLTDQTITQEQK